MVTSIRFEQYLIDRGPSREELFDALRLFNDFRKVTFGLSPRATAAANNTHWATAQIMGIAAEDGSGHSWILTVRFEDDENLNFEAHLHVDLYYQDTVRKGSVVAIRRPNATPTVSSAGEIVVDGRVVGQLPKQTFS